MAVILAFSSSDFSAERTSRIVEPLLRWLWPGATAAEIAVLHGLVRKAAHVVEYAILGALWFRTFVQFAPRRAGRAAALALALAVAWAIVDESHQAALAVRTGSGRDVALDAAGAGAAVLAMWVGWRLFGTVATTAVLWLAAAAGAVIITANLASGGDSGTLWLTVPLAVLLLLTPWLRPSPPHPPLPPKTDRR